MYGSASTLDCGDLGMIQFGDMLVIRICTYRLGLLVTRQPLAICCGLVCVCVLMCVCECVCVLFFLPTLQAPVILYVLPLVTSRSGSENE